MTEKDKDFLEGVAISAACHVLPARKVFREPIAYSYNGVILPKLPEWDREAYPYAIMLYQNGKDSDATNYIFLYISPSNFNCVGLFNENIGTEGLGHLYRFLIDGGTKWEYVAEQKFSSVYKNFFFWTSHDILNADGSVYLEAIEPIPIYE